MPLSATRYTTSAFPAYRHVPGQNPHPVNDPRGHSYHPPGSSPPQVEYQPPQHWQRSRDYLFGCDLYNHGYWWEAHEAWEGLWQLTDKSGVQGHFLQGLIQVSAAHLKLYQGLSRGVVELIRRSTEHLRFVIEEVGHGSYMGLRVHDWHSVVTNYFELTHNNPVCEGEMDPRVRDYLLGQYPYIILRGLE